MDAPLTKTEQVLAVLNAGGRIGRQSGRDGIFVLRDKQGREVPAWQNAIKAADRVHRDKTARAARLGRESSMQTLNFALRIADANVRSDIECFAYWHEHGSRNVYDVSKPCQDEKATPEEQAANLKRVSDAVQYIARRHPDSFPWRLVADPSFPNIVHFEEKR